MEDARIKAQKDAQGWASVMAGNVYRHFKGGEYHVIGVATHSETGEQMVIYQALYGDHALWARPAAMWFQTVMYQGRQVPRAGRFQPQGQWPCQQ